MLGFNGGLLGKKSAPSILNAKGVWLPNEQSVAKRSAEWPLSAGADPTPSLNPLLWYDFSDSTTVTTAGSPLQVTQITSKGSAARTLTSSATGPLYSTAGMNGKDCIDWGSQGHQNYLNNTSTAAMTIAEAYVIIDAAFNGYANNYNCLISGTANPNYILAQATSWIQTSAFTEVYINNGVDRFSTSPFNSPSIDTRCLLRLVGSPLSWVNGFQLGNDRSNYSLGRGWSGLMGEVIVYSSPLTSEQRSLQQSWLASKWDITLS